MINIINQLFEIERKAKDQNIAIFERNFDRIKNELDTLGFIINDPIGKIYDPRDTSIEANIVGNSSSPKVVKVMKPAIFQKDGEGILLIQKGIIIAE
ncbi:hypothetical protein NAT51_11960 [Flavobacterium amniphilum]|uniref:hypothetical protein n=1 Tax=Flavobacterium amniphilum TaxID=1834035 RepID=UPI00202A77C2|nr:hypothetical protein [Flavobacterium amniphilum]MCL9806242.1 hypothetical protein [Flavobacterium amniphilum]